MFSERVRAIQPSATLAVDGRAKELMAAGVDVVSFAAGEPDFDTPEHVLEAAERAVRQGALHKYTAAAGLPQLRAAVAEETNRLLGRDVVTAAHVIVTNGAKQAIFSAIAGIVEPGDDILLPVPYWTSYPEIAGFFGGRSVPVAPSGDACALPSVADLEAARTDRTKLLVWCSPSNPTGAVADAEQTRDVLTWAREHDLWVLSDEIYRQLYYGEGTVATMRALGLGDYPKLVVIDGVSKTHSMTGWRVGWVIGDPAFIQALTRLQSHMASNVSNVAQAAALAAVAGPTTAAEAMLEAFGRRRTQVVEALAAIPGVRVNEPMGAFYVFPDVRELCERRGLASSEALALELLESAKVALVPGEAFGAPGFLRLSYALGDVQLETGLARIAAAVG